ncbi:hypothetical protein [Solirubrum puertoriconensis]|uniref:Uncharacterized protein n=1 Tax=Solirubrum puertoriconensis TaxID=1751427 RepID=A0A9X0HJ88_SOLP1|nr:hypothetical protein [Solirubrum puertoriconensis]KUG06897.1 hypothetical protein ASU33_06115 [Solirubrum puertoriconensis]
MVIHFLLPASLVLFPPIALQTHLPAAPTKEAEKPVEGCYKVLRIDSITTVVKTKDTRDERNLEGVYIIYAQREQRVYKITSPRKLTSYRKCIAVGKCYRFLLRSWFDPEPNELGEPAGGVVANGALVTREKRSGDLWDYEDLYYDTRLNNLCFEHVHSKKTPRKGRQ